MEYKKRLRVLVLFAALLFLLVGSGTILTRILLGQAEERLRSTIGFTQIYFSVFPPSLVIEDARSLKPSPFFSAERMSLTISFRSLLTREKPLNIYIENPVLRIYGIPGNKPERPENAGLGLVFPLQIERALIKGGEFYYWGINEHIRLQNVNALFTQRGDTFTLKAEAKNNLVILRTFNRTLKGDASLLIRGKGEEIDIEKIRISTHEGVIRAKGKLINPLEPQYQIQSSFTAEVDFITDLLDLPFDWEGKAKGKGILTRSESGLTASARFSCSSLMLNGFPMGKISGRVDYNMDSGGEVDFEILKRNTPVEYLTIRFNEKRVEGFVRGTYLDPVINYLDLPWPVTSPVWGTFSLTNNGLEVNGEFRDESLEQLSEDRFPFRGQVRLYWDREDQVTFSSSRMETTFGNLNVEGNLKLGSEVDVTIFGDVKDVKLARQFTSTVLGREFSFPEIRGAGEAEVHIFNVYDNPDIEMSFNLTPCGFDRFRAENVQGEAAIKQGIFTGTFHVEDSLMKGRVNVSADPENVRVDIILNRGFVEEILPSLDIHIPLIGIAAGTFTYSETSGSERIEGEFSSQLMNFGGQTFSQVRGKLDWQEGALKFPEFQFEYRNGRVIGSVMLAFDTRDFQIYLKSKDIDLTTLSSSLQGLLSFECSGGGGFGEDFVEGDFRVENFHLVPLQETTLFGKLKFSFSEDLVKIGLNGNFEDDGNKIEAYVELPLDHDAISGEIKGLFSDLDLLLPWRGAKGRIDYMADISGPRTKPRIKGAIDFQGTLLPIPKFAHAVRDFSGLVFVENGDFSLRSFQGSLAGGNLLGSGRLRLGRRGLDDIRIRIDGERLLLSPLERTRALADGSLTLLKDASRFVLDGDFTIHRLSWKRDFDEKFVFASSPFYQPAEEPTIFDDLNLNIRLRAEDNAWIENFIGNIRTRFDLKITGNVKSPNLLGDIQALGGEVYFQDRKFKIIRGQLSFFNPVAIDPYLSFQGETHVKDFRVTFTLNGFVNNLNRLNPELSSSPPLPPEDVLALLAVGEAFKRTYHYERSTQQGTASLLSFQLSEEAQKKAEDLFNIDRLRIDPFILGSSAEMTARLTIGKKISQGLFLGYSTNLANQREDITRLEWELTGGISIVGTRDDKGRVSIDVKVHKRF